MEKKQRTPQGGQTEVRGGHYSSRGKYNNIAKMKPIDEIDIKDFPQLANMSAIELRQDEELFLKVFRKRAS